MTTLAQALAKDARFMQVVDKTISDFTSLESQALRIMAEGCAEFLDLRYRQQRPIKHIARQLHRSERTLHRYVERQAHTWLYHRLVPVAPETAFFFHANCLEEV